MAGRAGRRLRRAVRRHQRAALRRLGPFMTLMVLFGPPVLLVLGLGLPALLSAAVGVWPPVLLATEFRRGAVGGVSMIGAAWWFREMAQILAAGAERDRKGALGEASTEDALKPLRRHGWRVVHDIEFPGRGNVDHLLVGTGGVIALDSKYTTQRLWVTPRGIGGTNQHWYLTEARRAAGLAQRALAEVGSPEIAVEPALVFWGPGAPEIDDGHTLIKGTLVLEGRQARQWRAALRARPPVLDEATARKVASRLRRLRVPPSS